MRRPRLPAPVLLALLAAPVVLAGCVLQGGPDDLFPVCEDRRQNGPSPTYTVEELTRRLDLRGGEPDESDRRALLEAARPRILTLQAAPYRSFEGNLTQLEAGPPGVWRLAARGQGGPDPRVRVDDAYNLTLELDGGLARVVSPLGERRPVLAPDAIARLAVGIAEASPELEATRARTPALFEVTLDPELPGCAFLLYAGPRDERAEVAVNLVHPRVVHVQTFRA